MTPQAVPTSSAIGKPSKRRLPVLDGLRGVAALIVVAFHIFDIDAVNSVFHGYLAVDFFFMLSGYVMGYAYDDRWSAMSLGSFLRRRIIRLHPMVVIGTLIGTVCFYFGASAFFPLVEKTSAGALALATLMGVLLIPSVKSMDIRGWGEAYTLNAPAWSLLFEYIANVAYALWIRKFRLRMLGALSAVFAGLLAVVILTSATGTISFGWLFTADHFWRGMVRLLFPFLTGLFLFRCGRTLRVKHAGIAAALALTAALAAPRVGPASIPWMNGVYEWLVIIALMPVIVLVGAGAGPLSRAGEKVCDFLGELSYPLYLVHYPLHYVWFVWLTEHKPAWGLKLAVGTGVYALCVALGWTVMRFADMPVRRRLARFARQSGRAAVAPFHSPR